MRVYVSGPMTGLPGFNFPAFKAATSRLRAAGFDVECPTEIAARVGEGKSWEDYMREDIPAVCRCDLVVTLPGWQRSRGARLECHVASELGLPLMSLEEALAEAVAA